MLIRLELLGFHFEFGHDQAEGEETPAPVDSQYPMAVQGWHPDEFGFRRVEGWEDKSVKPH